MDVEIRYARADEFAKVLELDSVAFGIEHPEADLELLALEVDPELVRVAVEGDRVAGFSAETPVPLSVPGGTDVRALGLTWVGVDVTHRRRGILRALLERQLRDAAEAGYAASVLGASEGGIYGRHGYGVATLTRHVRVRRRRTELTMPVDTSAIRRVDAAEARMLLPSLYERWRAVTPGAVGMTANRWEFTLRDAEHLRRGASQAYYLVHPDGFVSYRLKPDWTGGEPQHLCWLETYAPITAEAHAALWQLLLSLDLVGTIESFRVPIDDPIALLVSDPRRVESVWVSDGMWLRPLDVPTLLGSRRYDVEVDAVLAVDDPLLGSARYRLAGGPDGAACTRTDAAADVYLDVSALGAVSLGGTRVAQLARAGQVQAEDAGLLARLDRAFLADRAPEQGTKI